MTLTIASAPPRTPLAVRPTSSSPSKAAARAPAPRGYPSESTFVASPSAAARRSTAAPAQGAPAAAGPLAWGAFAAAPVEQEDIGPDGNDDTKKSKYYDPDKNEKGLLSRENRVNQHPNIPKALKEALLEGLTMQDLVKDPALSKVYAELPEGSDASSRASSLAISNGLRESLRRSFRNALNETYQKLLALMQSVR